MDPQGLNEFSRLRASDADRDKAASVINNALAEGRLTAEEHSDRLDAIYSAKTHADLVPLLNDLPGHTAAIATAAAAPVAALLCGVSRKGRWHPEPVTHVLSVLGGADLDFREAVLPGREITLVAVSVLGGINVIVPPEMRVVDSGVAILGGQEVAGDSDESVQPGAPILRITGQCVLGGIVVKPSRARATAGTGRSFASSASRRPERPAGAQSATASQRAGRTSARCRTGSARASAR